MTKQKYIFTAAGLGDAVKGKLYTIVPEPQQDGSRASGAPAAAAAILPLTGTLSGSARNARYTLKDMIGRNIVCSLTIRAGLRTLDIPEAVVNVTRKNRIVTTAVVGGQGTVKEFIGEDDMDIDITVAGTAVDESGYMIDEYPEEGLATLIEFLEAKRIDAYSPFLALFDLDGGDFHLVVTGYSVKQETHSNRQVVAISAVSDYDYTIFYEEN